MYHGIACVGHSLQEICERSCVSVEVATCALPTICILHSAVIKCVQGCQPGHREAGVVDEKVEKSLRFTGRAGLGCRRVSLSLKARGQCRRAANCDRCNSLHTGIAAGWQKKEKGLRIAKRPHRPLASSTLVVKDRRYTCRPWLMTSDELSGGIAIWIHLYVPNPAMLVHRAAACRCARRKVKAIIAARAVEVCIYPTILDCVFYRHASGGIGRQTKVTMSRQATVKRESTKRQRGAVRKEISGSGCWRHVEKS